MRPLTRSCLLLLLGRLFLLTLPFLLGIYLPSLWSVRFPLHAPTLILLSFAKVRLSPTLTLSPPHDLVLWTDGPIPFPFCEGGSGILANCSLCGTEATLSFSTGPLFSSFSTEACAILHALCWSRQHNKSAISLLFSFYLTLVLSSPPCSLHLSLYLKLSGRSGRNCLVSSPVLSDYNGSLDTRFSQGTMRLMSWPDGERYLRSLQSLVVSLLSLVSTLLFSRTGGVVSH